MDEITITKKEFANKSALACARFAEMMKKPEVGMFLAMFSAELMTDLFDEEEENADGIS